MKDFFNFRGQVQEDYSKNNDKKKKELVELEKDADDPCQAGWVQLGMKTKNGRQVPNCVPLDEAKKMVESAKKKKKMTEDELEKDSDDPCWSGYVQLGTKMKDGKEVPNCVPMEQVEEKINATIKESNEITEGYYDYPDYGPIGASEMAQTQLHFIKYAADDITRCLKDGCPMPEWYQNKLAKMEGDMEGLYSYMKGKTRKMKARQADRYGMGMSMYGESTLTESTVNVSVRDAKKANDIAQDMFRGEYKTDGSNSFVFKKGDAADDFKAELKKQKIQLDEAKSGGKEAYRKFFDKALKKFGVKSPAELKGDKEKEFYDYIDKNWKSDKEESGDMSEAYINEVLKPSDDVSKWIEDFRKSDAPQFEGKDDEERREMAVAAWLSAREEAGIED